MNKREYLRSLGFKVGERGRFTPEMLTALKNSSINFEEPIAKVAVVDVECVVDTVQKLPPQPKQREGRTLYGYTKEGTKVGFVLCFDCKQHMMYCNCRKGITAPSIVNFTKEDDVFVRAKV